MIWRSGGSAVSISRCLRGLVRIDITNAVRVWASCSFSSKANVLKVRENYDAAAQNHLFTGSFPECCSHARAPWIQECVWALRNRRPCAFFCPRGCMPVMMKSPSRANDVARDETQPLLSLLLLVCVYFGPDGLDGCDSPPCQRIVVING